MIESNYLHRGRFQNSFCVSVIGRKGGICPGKNKGTVSAWTPVGNLVAVSNRLSKQKLRLGGTWVTNFVGSQSHPETHSTLKYSFIWHFMNNVWKNRVRWPVIEMQLSRGRKRGEILQVCRSVVLTVWQGMWEGFIQEYGGFSWNLEVASYSENSREVSPFLLVCPLLLWTVCCFCKLSISPGSVAKPDEQCFEYLRLIRNTSFLITFI